MPKLLESIVTVTELFYQYATQDEECDVLNKAELKELLLNEFKHILKVRTPCPE